MQRRQAHALARQVRGRVVEALRLRLGGLVADQVAAGTDGQDVDARVGGEGLLCDRGQQQRGQAEERRECEPRSASKPSVTAASGSCRLKSAAAIESSSALLRIFYQRSIARSLRRATNRGSTRRRLRSAASGNGARGHSTLVG